MPSSQTGGYRLAEDSPGSGRQPPSFGSGNHLASKPAIIGQALIQQQCEDRAHHSHVTIYCPQSIDRPPPLGGASLARHGPRLEADGAARGQLATGSFLMTYKSEYERRAGQVTFFKSLCPLHYATDFHEVFAEG